MKINWTSEYVGLGVCIYAHEYTILIYTQFYTHTFKNNCINSKSNIKFIWFSSWCISKAA